ncbi:hypothetical protein [Ramlibacter tataouinensis]|uniref:Lipoprotein n=1 Tax=Ramlibacter tataouinensis (strain ATCC BAA-407 / DSM 14655 / LMG 21543 / TTB310) TaxID=365046 RepID=F5XWL5_RAMTT|nr:hypothetical protein [Ramlibacter tataouinensis]AEG94159.1 conserved hypothetical protein [Ramlibacter tataouinensis TTB310]
MIRAAIAVAAVLGLAACTEKPQTAGGVKSDAASFQGTGMPYVAGGWKPGDKASWEQQLKTRTQQGQNDYAKVN